MNKDLMNKEFIIKTINCERKIFLQDGFFDHDTLVGNLHKHNYAEIHAAIHGRLTFRAGDEFFSLADGDILLIPAGIFHCCEENAEKAHHMAFQIEYETDHCQMEHVPVESMHDFFREIDACRVTQNYNRIAADITWLFSRFYTEKIEAQDITDYGFLIRDFFSRRYNEDVGLSDLAELLHLSYRQTERLVVEYTGNTFRREIIATRKIVAQQLSEKNDLPMNQIADYVGYRSYAGFWKVMTPDEPKE